MAPNILCVEYHSSFLSISTQETNELSVLKDTEVGFFLKDMSTSEEIFFKGPVANARTRDSHMVQGRDGFLKRGC